MKKNRLDKIIEIITQSEVETQDELIAYLKARNYYMEELVEAQKKTSSVLADILTSSKPRR